MCSLRAVPALTAPQPQCPTTLGGNARFFAEPEETGETTRGSRADKRYSATRPCWSKRNGGCDGFMKLRQSSRGCKSRPAKGEPTHAGSQPCDGDGNGTGDA
jgi:hypothetical protein